MRVKLEARLTSIRQQREQLRSLIELAEAKQVATKTIKSLDSLAAVGDKEVSGLADSVRARLDEEDARLDLATRNVSDGDRGCGARRRRSSASLRSAAAVCSAVPAMSQQSGSRAAATAAAASPALTVYAVQQSNMACRGGLETRPYNTRSPFCKLA